MRIRQFYIEVSLRVPCNDAELRDTKLQVDFSPIAYPATSKNDILHSATANEQWRF